MLKKLFKYIRVIRFEFNIHIHRESPEPVMVEVEVMLPPLGTRERAEIASNKRDEWRRLHKEAASAYHEALQKQAYVAVINKANHLAERERENGAR